MHCSSTQPIDKHGVAKQQKEQHIKGIIQVK